MLTPLTRDFAKREYGLNVRLVDERDTEFILSLRSDKVLSKHLHSMNNDIQKHLEWLTQYKLREIESRDYYFIYHKDKKPIGLNRIYNITEFYATIGSWICSPTNDAEDSMATYFFMLDILFEELNLDLTVFEVRKKNTHVWKLHQQAGATRVGQSDVDYYYVMNKDSYLSRRDKLLSIYNLTK